MGAPDEVGMGTQEEGAIGAPEEESPEECTIPKGLIRNTLIAAALGAGAIHLWAAWAHSGITRVLVFFTLVAAMQLWLAAAVIWVRDIPWSVLIGAAAANAAVVVVHILSRTTGVPGQPPSTGSMDTFLDEAISTPGSQSGYMAHEETFGVVDMTASFLEVVVVVCVLMLILNRRRRPPEESEIDGTAARTDVAEDSAAST